MSNLKLSPEVTDILSRSTITETLLVLPDGQLDRKLYEQVAKTIKLAGGAWKTNKKGFLFDGDPRQKLGLALESGAIVDEKKLRQAFYTPAAIAREVAALAGVAGHLVLEPSAGGGALADACMAAGAGAVNCIEFDAKEAARLSGRFVAYCGDFLKLDPTYKLQGYQRIVMNPPFTRGADIKHVKHALKFLAPGGRLFSIMAPKTDEKLKEMGLTLVKRFPAGSFKESGTAIETILVSFEA